MRLILRGLEKRGTKLTGLLQLLIHGIMEGSVYAMVGAAVVLVFKATKIVSIAHGQILAFGGLFFYYFYGFFGLPIIPAVLLTFLIAGFMGFGIERVALRPLIGQPLFAAFLVTFAVYVFWDGIFMLILKGGILSVPKFLPRESFQLGGVKIEAGQAMLLLFTLIIFGLIGIIFRYSKLGLGMRATAEDHQLAQSTGIAVKNIFSKIWILSSMVAAAGGIFTTHYIDIYYSYPLLGVKGLIVALVGGLESIPGALLSGLILGVLESVSASYLDAVFGGGVKEVAAYAFLLLILLVKPYGLFGLIRIERI